MVTSHPTALYLMANSHPIALSHGKLSTHFFFYGKVSHPIVPSYGELSHHCSFLWCTHPIPLFLMVNSHPIAPCLMVNSHPNTISIIAIFIMVNFLMVNSHPILLFLIVNSHPITPSYGELLPHSSFSL